jgi:hypothetical protein
VVTVGEGHRSRLPTSDPTSEGVDGRPGYEVGWLDEEAGFAESARPLRLRAAALLEDALYQGYAFAPSRVGYSLALAESLRIGGAWGRALEHCARGVRFAKNLPFDVRKTLLFETWCVLQHRVEPLTRGAVLAGFDALDRPTTTSTPRRLGDGLPPARILSRPASRD